MEKLAVENTEWNLTPLSSGDDDKQFEKKREEWLNATNSFVKKWKNNSEYLNDPKILKQALDEFDTWSTKYGIEGDEVFYFHLRTNQDQSNPELKAKEAKSNDFVKNILNEIQFFQLSLSKIPEKEQNKFLKEIQLNKYHHFLKKCFENAKHVLSEPEEKIMNLKSRSAYEAWVSMVSEFISKEERVVLDYSGKEAKKGYAELLAIVHHQNKKIRDTAGKAINEILAKHADSAEAEINAILNDKKVNDELRKFARPDEERHLVNDIETEVIDAMLDAVSSKYNLSHRFYELSAKLLKQKKLEYHERNVNINFGKKEKNYSYEESINLVYNIFNNLDKQFGEIVKEMNDNAQIDVFPRKGKWNGAFCTYGLKIHPTYVLLNHTGKLNDVTTIAHELGHAINGTLLKEAQPGIYCDTSTATAEVASTFMEDFVFRELLKEADEEEKLAILFEKLRADVNSIMRQVACYKFEQELHKEFRIKGHLSKEEIGKIFQKNMSAYMGPFVEQSEGSENWWVYWSHIRTFFYTYSYASGLLISKSLQSLVRKDSKNIEKVKEFLSAGISDSASNIFKKAGIDITQKSFWLSGLEEVESLLNETEALAKKLKKI